MPRPARLCLFALMLWVCGCTSLRPIPRDEHLATGPLPTRRCGDDFLVEVNVNGRGPYAMLLDTGAELTVVSPRLARELSADVRPYRGQALGSGGQTVRLRRALHIRSLQFRDSVLNDFEAPVIDIPGLDTASGGRCDGILGFALFRNVLLTYDYPGSEVRLSDGTLDRDDPATLPSAHANPPTIELKIGDATVLALVDTGDNGALQLPSRLRLEYKTTPRASGSTIAVGGDGVARQGRLDGQVALANTTLDQPIVEEGGPPLLGTAILHHFAVTFDQRSQLVRFEHPGPSVISFPGIRGLGDASVPTSRGTLRVTAVFPGSPASERDIRVGDEIVAVDGRPIAEIMCETRDYWRGRDQVALTIRRDDRDRVIICPIAVLVP